MDDFERELKLGFLEEAEQNLTNTEQCFLSLEENPDNMSLLDQIFRLAHNFKGSAKAVGFNDLGHFAHQFESLLLKVKTKEIPTNSEVINLLLKCNDHLVFFIGTLKSDIDANVDSSELLTEIESAMNGSWAVNTPDNEIPSAQDFPDETSFEENLLEQASQELPAEASFEETPNLSLSDDSQITEAFNEDAPPAASLLTAEIPDSIFPGEMNFDELASEVEQLQETPQNVIPLKDKKTELQAKNETAAPIVTKPKEVESKKSPPPSNNSDESIRVSLARLEKLLNFVGEMVILQSVLKEQTQGQSLLIRKTVHQLGKVTKEVQDISMSLRMVPLKQTFQKMQRIVRDTSAALGKKVNLTLSGEDTEVDKTILESISDPLVHLIRNACDHGIESLEKRKANGKSETGEVKLSAYHHAGKLVIEIKDDGGGINPEILIEKAREKGILKPGQNISEKEAINLIFHPGFSTKAQVTDVSGRGVGMDVVRSNIEKISGEVQVSTYLGIGTIFRVYLPLTLAIIDGMIIECSDQKYVVPLSHIHESLQLNTEDLKQTSTAGEILLLRGENIPLYRLNSMIGLKKKTEPLSSQIAIVVRILEKPFAVLVDDIIGQSQVVIKKLGDEISNLDGFAGSAILGDGRPALILELADLVKKYGHKSDGRRIAS